jgi:hypothetical protein
MDYRPQLINRKFNNNCFTVYHTAPPKKIPISAVKKKGFCANLRLLWGLILVNKITFLLDTPSIPQTAIHVNTF